VEEIYTLSMNDWNLCHATDARSISFSTYLTGARHHYATGRAGDGPGLLAAFYARHPLRAPPAAGRLASMLAQVLVYASTP